MVRGALWLLQVIGEGNTFTKNELREAFPGVSQVDRRIRDLRDYGWVVYSSAEDATLLREDQRFVSAGVPVWDPKARRANAPEKAISTKERQAVLARDGYMCTLCGIAGGESYPDDAIMTAVLAVSRRTVTSNDGRPSQVLITECKRCRSGDAPAPLAASDVVAVATELDPRELRRLVRWMERGRRGATELDRAWSSYLRVSPDERPQVAERIRKLQ
jgi:hypothetical protein